MDISFSKEQEALIPLARVSSPNAKVEGLLGNNNNNVSDDLMPKESIQSLNITDITQRAIYHEFGETCELYMADIWTT